MLSGLLMALSFAPFEAGEVAWFALVPLMISCAYARPGGGSRPGWIAGAVFWLVTMFWLTRVTWLGWFLISIYSCLYVVPVAWTASWWFRRHGTERILFNAAFMVVITAVWVGSEFLRSNLFTGFPWNPLGASQHANLALIQHASWGGVYAISALLVWVNAAIALTGLRYLLGHARHGRRPHSELMLGMAVLVIAFVTGGNMSREKGVETREVRVALIQPSIPQDNKWDSNKVEMIYSRLRDYTSAAVVFTRPDLVVWPETALPYDVRLSEPCYSLVDGLSRLGAPLLVGSMDAEYIADHAPRYFNSSFLFNTNGMIVQYYEKRHLVLFGEYVPLHEHITFITAMTPIMESFSPGTTSTVFRIPGRDIPFSSLICFEDTLAYLGRASVRNGARMLVNQTNDAWFDPLWGSRQHLALSVFRAVENRVPLVRAANTGYSCAVDPRGRVKDLLVGDNGSHDGPGFQLTSVGVPPDDMPLTFYTLHGDVLAWAFLVIAALPVAQAWREERRSPA